MAFEIYLRKELQNEIANYIDTISKKITVNTLSIQEGMLIKNPYRIPIEHILFIKEV